MTVTSSVATGNITTPEVEVIDANGEISTDKYKVYTTNSGVAIKVPVVENYNVSVTGATKDEAKSTSTVLVYSIGTLAKDAEVTVVYSEEGKSKINIEDIENLEGVKSLKVAAGNELIADGSYVYDGTALAVSAEPEAGYKIDKITVNGEEKTSFTVDDAVLEYLISATAIDLRSTVSVTVDSEMLNGKITINDVETTESVILPSTEVIVKVPLKGNYELTKLDVAEIDNEVVDLKNGTVTFTTAAAKTAYTVTAESYNTNNRVSLETVDGNYVESVSVAYGKDTSYDTNTVEYVIPTNSEVRVAVKTIESTGYIPNGITVSDGTKEVEVKDLGNGVYSFVADGKHMTYTIAIGIKDTRSDIVVESANGASVSVDGTALDENTTTVKVLNGSIARVVAEPEDNKYITSVVVKDETGALVTDAFTFDGYKAVAKITAEANKTYKVSVETADIITANTEAQVSVSYVIALNKAVAELEAEEAKGDAADAEVIAALKAEIAELKTEVEKQTWNAGFTAVDSNINVPANVTIQYSAGTYNISEVIDLSGLKNYITDETIYNALFEEQEIWLALDKTPVKDIEDVFLGIKDSIKFLDNSLTKYIYNQVIASLNSAEVSIKGELHAFGDKTEELVRVVYDGTYGIYGPATVENTITAVDNRIATEIYTKDSIELTYGSFAEDSAWIDMLLSGADGNGKEYGLYKSASAEKLAKEYQDMLEVNVTGKATLVGADAGEYVVAIVFPNTDLDYKSATKNVTVTITKATAVVDVTDNNVIKKANIASVDWADLVTVKPGEEVVITDTVDNIPFVVGIDMLNSTAVAQLDLGDFPGASAVIGLTGNGIEFKLSELVDGLKSLGIDLGDETANEIVAALIEVKETLGVEITVKVTALDDINDLVPQEIGMYVVGAVTMDNNYETAANATYLVVAAEPVGVAFIDANENNVRLATFGEAYTMEAYAYDLSDADKTPLDGYMSYRYVGMESDGEPYYSETAPTQAGTYTVLALYRDNPANPQRVGLGVGALVIAPAEASVAVEDLLVVPYTEAPVDIKEEMIESTPEDAKIAVITGSISVDGDFSEEGLNSVVGNLNIDLPERADSIIENLLGKDLETADITVKDLERWIGEIKTVLENVEEIELDTAPLDEILAMVAEMPNVTSITFKDDVKPTAIGAYFVGAVVFDPNYTPEVGAGMLLITPEIENDELSWDYNDMNGIITLPVLEEQDNLLAATAAKGSDVKYFIIGTDENGNEVRIHTADISYDSLVSKGFGNGVYTQVAYIPIEVAGSFSIGYPIVRTFVVAPQYVLVDFQPDLNIENARKFSYTGKPVEIPTVVTYADGTEVPAEKLEKYYTVKYVGVDSTGAEYNSETAPANVGLYTVTAVYEERNAAGELLYAGVNVGLMAITPIDHTVTVDDLTVCCDCGCDCTPENIDPDCKNCTATYELAIGVANDEIATITIIEDGNGNINILVPEDWNLSVDNTADDVVADLIEQITNFSGLADSNAVSEALGDVIDELQALKDADTPYDEADVDAVIEELITTLDELNTEKVKDMILALAEEVKAIEGIDEATVNEILAALNAIEDAKTEEDAEEAAAKVIVLIEKISGQEIDDITKLALGAVAVQVKAMDFTDIKVAVKEEAKAAIEEIISQLEAIKDVDVAGAADGTLGDIIEKLEEINTEIAAAEDEIYSALSELTEALEEIKAELGKVNSITINGALPTKCSVYNVTVVGFGANYKVAKDEAILTIAGHDVVVDAAVKNSCTTDGLTEGSHCERCGKVLKAQEVVKAHGHEWGDWYTTKKPTTTSKGEERSDCKHCDVFRVRALEKLPSGGNGSGSGSNSSGTTTVVTPVGGAKTGDTSNVPMWISLAAVSAGAALILFFTRKRRPVKK